MKYPHLILNNPIGATNYINTSRDVQEKESDEDVIEKDYSFIKERLELNHYNFNVDRERRKNNRTIKLPYQLEYIEIKFFDQFKGANYYEQHFGLIPVTQRAFNKTVLFYIKNEKLFSTFISLIEKFYNSPVDEDPSKHEYNTITIVYSFEFLSSEKIKNVLGERIIISLTDNLRGNFEWSEIEDNLITYLNERNIDVSRLTEGVLEISNAYDYIDEIANNFDVIQKIQSIPPVRVSPDEYGTPMFGWNFRTLSNDSLPTVGIIDTGVDNIEPLRPLLVGQTSILDRPTGIGCSHGTSIASLAAFGKELTSGMEQIKSYANLYSIQVLHREVGDFSYIKLRDAIVRAHHEHNIRIFNLSICNEYSFNYNVDFSEYAKMLDKLAYEYDILIFISTGNLISEYRNLMMDEEGEDTPLINYPNHFYNEFNHDYSQPSNIGSPAESMNNVTVGAIASNNFDNYTDLTVSPELPSYYSRKYHVDYTQNINGGRFNKNQKNKNIFKPDILMPGGDWINNDSKMTVLGRGHTPQTYYLKLSGTSLSTPLASNLAAKIITKYPEINMQSVKALMINSAESTKINQLLTEIINKCKEKESLKIYGCGFNDLPKADKTIISTKFSCKKLTKNIEGHGVPSEDKCLNSDTKKVTFIIEDQIKSRNYQVKHIKLPKYLLESRVNKVLKITGTICFKFSPTKDDSIDYNPLHISFNILNAQESSQFTAFLLSNKIDEDTRKRPFETDERNEKLKIKASMQSWSEDFGFFNRQIFSNTQKLERTINKNDLLNIDNEIAIAVRCIGKKYIDENIENPYSLIITIEEYENTGLNHDLYDKISAINEVEAVTVLDTSLDIEIAD